MCCGYTVQHIGTQLDIWHGHGHGRIARIGTVTKHRMYTIAVRTPMLHLQQMAQCAVWCGRVSRSTVRTFMSCDRPFMKVRERAPAPAVRDGNLLSRLGVCGCLTDARQCPRAVSLAYGYRYAAGVVVNVMHTGIYTAVS